MTEASVAAQAVPQPAGARRPGGSVLYLCGGTNEYDRPCGKLLFVWVPPARPADGGAVEIKCRRCKALNEVPLSAEKS